MFFIGLDRSGIMRNSYVLLHILFFLFSFFPVTASETACNEEFKSHKAKIIGDYDIDFFDVLLDKVVETLNEWRVTPFGENEKPVFYTANKTMPLFKHYPKFRNKVSHVKLGSFPSPVKKLKNLESKLGMKSLYIKDDSGCCTPFGGNKIRKLEFLLADALENGVKSVITVGAAGSNHSLATIACAQKVGLKAIAMLTPQIPAIYLRRNLLASQKLGGELHLFPTKILRNIGIINKFLQISESTGKYPYFITTGGSCPVGGLGLINAVFELKEQIDDGILPEPDYIYVACGGGGGTTVGLSLGLKLAGLKTKVVAVGICKGLDDKNRYKKLFEETSKFLSSLDPSIPEFKFDLADVVWRNDFSKIGFENRGYFSDHEYSETDKEIADAISLFSDSEGIRLDGTYTGKVFCALLRDLKSKKLKDEVVLFWNTFSSGVGNEVIGDMTYHELPRQFHHFFQSELQENDLSV
jgi:1-aminocyclopropane-1-carboxylate deaminase/D-cysteine desulfhydrase-like pyridoxal-dependent ACC family enzyme